MLSAATLIRFWSAPLHWGCIKRQRKLPLHTACGEKRAVRLNIKERVLCAVGKLAVKIQRAHVGFSPFAQRKFSRPAVPLSTYIHIAQSERSYFRSHNVIYTPGDRRAPRLLVALFHCSQCQNDNTALLSGSSSICNWDKEGNGRTEQYFTQTRHSKLAPGVICGRLSAHTAT